MSECYNEYRKFTADLLLKIGEKYKGLTTEMRLNQNDFSGPRIVIQKYGQDVMFLPSHDSWLTVKLYGSDPVDEFVAMFDHEMKRVTGANQYD